ncbi:hypothetical protein CC1G_15576 [Coprinopsis cinerea okayama7|uniref:Uncharacterized protein n=1 Tax=Coprinopsis cinerea (strain Okayama-7 / 130 / ATCC MYA-4618 / FGSC 9003) TaxID=240176 RepID=D6RNB7_COPC7|nr:hypothetical protein CC1G_15576 [Coprinopsis cinerea okayama7\|eukprot:XP_002911033.1 hypothetical protein CC1G_15576 [Coprinopsis cinerea okayama7\
MYDTLVVGDFGNVATKRAGIHRQSYESEPCVGGWEDEAGDEGSERIRISSWNHPVVAIRKEDACRTRPTSKADDVFWGV